MQVCFCVCRWKMNVRLRKCSTWLITSAPRSWGRPRAAARRTTAASRCCAASSRETPWVHLSGCLPVVLSVTNRITEYVCQCFCLAPQVSGFMEHLKSETSVRARLFVSWCSEITLSCLTSMVEFLLHVPQDWWIRFEMSCPICVLRLAELHAFCSYSEQV